MAPVAPAHLGKSPLVSGCRLARERKHVYVSLSLGHPFIISTIGVLLSVVAKTLLSFWQVQQNESQRHAIPDGVNRQGD